MLYHITINTKVNYNFDIIIPVDLYLCMWYINKEIFQQIVCCFL